MDGGLVFDIGMHRGEDTAYYLWRGHSVVGFEANPDLVQACQARFAAEISAGRLTILPGVVRGTRQEGCETFFVNRTHSEWGTAVPAWRDRNALTFHADSEPIRAPRVSLPSALDRFGVPLYAKIDIEGLDHEILTAFGAFVERPAFVSIESAKTSWSDLEAEIDLLASLGYTRFAAVQQRTIPGTIAHGFTFQRYASGPFGEDITGWTDRPGILARYRRIFRAYAVWGDTSWLQRRFGRTPIAAAQALLRRSLPGWYDTHARRD